MSFNKTTVVNGFVNRLALRALTTDVSTNLTSKLDSTANAVSASKLQTARTITLSGDLTGSANFDGSSNISINTSVSDDSHLHSYTNITNKPTTVNGLNLTDLTGPASTLPVMCGVANIGSSYTYARADHIHPTDTSRAPLYSPSLTGLPTAPTAVAGTNNTQIATTSYADTAVLNMSNNIKAGNVSTATKLQTARTIAGVSFDGSANIDIPFANLTSKPNTLSGYGILDAAPANHVGSSGNVHGVVTTTINGFMMATDKIKLNNIAEGANNYIHPTSGVTPGTYNSITVDTNGHITSGSNPTTLAGYGITDAAAQKGTDTVYGGAKFSLNGTTLTITTI